MAARQVGQNGPADFYWSIPPVTRTHVTAIVLSTLVTRLGIITPVALYLHWPSVFKLEVSSRELKDTLKLYSTILTDRLWPDHARLSVGRALLLHHRGSLLAMLVAGAPMKGHVCGAAAVAPDIKLSVLGALLLQLAHGAYMGVSGLATLRVWSCACSQEGIWQRRASILLIGQLGPIAWPACQSYQLGPA